MSAVDGDRDEVMPLALALLDTGAHRDAADVPGQLDGANDLFTCVKWTRPLRAEVPEPLRSRLIEHVTATGTEPMRFGMRHGYGADAR